MGAKSKKSVFLVSLMVLGLGAMFFVSGCGKDPVHTVEDLTEPFETAGYSVNVDYLSPGKMEEVEQKLGDGVKRAADVYVKGVRRRRFRFKVAVFDTKKRLDAVKEKHVADGGDQHDIVFHDNLLIVLRRGDWDVFREALNAGKTWSEAVATLPDINEDETNLQGFYACEGNLRKLGTILHMYAYDNPRFPIPRGETSGEVFRKLQDYGKDYGLEDRSFSCPGNPVDKVDFDDPDGVGYYIDPDVPLKRNPQRAVAACRAPWEINHGGEGVHVLFADAHVKFIRPGDSGPPDKISNPYIPEDTDIYADTGDPEKHAWIRWEK